MTIGCREGYEGFKEWYVVSEEPHAYHSVGNKGKGRERLLFTEEVEMPPNVPLGRHRDDSYPSTSGISSLLTHRHSPSDVLLPNVAQHTPASTSQLHQYESNDPTTSSRLSEALESGNEKSTPASRPTSVSAFSRDLTALLYSLSPNLASFTSLLLHRGVYNIESLVSLLQREEAAITAFCNNLGCLTDLETSKGLKPMPIFNVNALSKKVVKLAKPGREKTELLSKPKVEVEELVLD